MRSGWNDWYHVVVSSYGSWLPGDRRGWRTQKHRRDVPGDYRNPPPEEFGQGLRRHISRLDIQATILNGPQRRQVGCWMLESFAHQDIEILALATGGEHCHLLGRFRPCTTVRMKTGLAKWHASRNWGKQYPDHKLWARYCHVVPIRNREHQVHVVGYILAHADSGAWCWSFRDSPPELSQ
jgi:REP element-mobilizing transposase RayT